MGVRNVRVSLSPLHSELEALFWTMECMRNLRQFRSRLQQILSDDIKTLQ